MTGSNYKSRSAIQSDLFNSLFGFDPFDSLSECIKIPTSSANPNNRYSFYSEKDYTDGKGNIVKEVNDNGKKSVSKVPLSKHLISHGHPNFFVPAACNNKLPAAIAGGDDFPQADCYIDEQKSEVIRINMAGIAQNRVKISYKDENLYVRISEAEPTNEKRAYFMKGIKSTDSEYEKYFYIDPARFDVKGLTKYYCDGILTLVIPRSQNVVAGEMVFGDSGWEDSIKPIASAPIKEEAEDEVEEELGEETEKKTKSPRDYSRSED